MITLPLGIFCTFLVFVFSIGDGNWKMYMNTHAIVLVGLGTFTVLLFSNPWSVISHLIRDIGQLFKPSLSFSDVQNELMRLSKNRNAQLSLKEELAVYAQDLWKQGVEHELFVVLLSQKKQEIEQRSISAIQCLKNLSKYPPALGMAGTVIGVVSLFQSLGANKDKLGSSLALAMTATFFGLVMANALVMPLADRLQVKHTSHKQYLQHVYQILLLINQNEVSELIEDEVKLRAI